MDRAQRALCAGWIGNQRRYAGQGDFEISWPLRRVTRSDALGFYEPLVALASKRVTTACRLIATLTTPINFVRASNTSRTTAYFNSIRSTAIIAGVKGQTAQAVRGGWGFSRNLSSRVFANVFNDNKYDKFQALDLRVILGGGLGYQVWKADSGRLSVVVGFAWIREKFSPATIESFTREPAEAYWGNEFNYKMNSRTNLVQAFRMFNNLSNTGQYRVNSARQIGVGHLCFTEITPCQEF